MKQLLLGLLAATTISSDVLLRAVVSVNVRNASGNAASSSAAASGSNREEVEEPREPPSKRRRLRGKQAPSKTDEKQVGKGEPVMETCSICLEDFPACDLERYFDACGAGDICGPGHKFCSKCAIDMKEQHRSNKKNAHCPVCNKTVERQRPNHTCEVCNNEGGPRERRDGTTGGTTGTPDEAPRVGCWGCGRLKTVRTTDLRWGYYRRIMTALLGSDDRDASEAFVVHRRDMTPAETAFLENMERSDARGEVLGAFADVVPLRLQADPLTLVRVMVMAYEGRPGQLCRPAISFTLDDWNRLPEGLRESVGLTTLAIYTGVLTDSGRDIPEALQRNDNWRLQQAFEWLAEPKHFLRRPIPWCFSHFVRDCRIANGYLRLQVPF
mmetsp:Transcript_25109/g.63121  ORF Transcript_25109/g.63121 Transcript_25109/m.63121 type:complete len:383 (-) Transcript_25109:98-1246(-)|eukprot:CAMPEP_0178992702 /NCGR_PEP_ID=MMETSP0795-20121207/6266_1 /TAXON_ID=88552 /ORGANISM="Amoebophrya sp., Strain Ameob2" /LENGTH=382 /DNA_ID=CAMNT_0020684623 /DNA_START=168 /DNA_END=1316 /DNA_ORIENTATION=-